MKCNSMRLIDSWFPFQNELEDWDEDNSGTAGWDEINNENTKQLIREKRKELRSQKQQRQKAERLTSDR